MSDIKVFISNRNAKCSECRQKLGPKAWITLAGKRGSLCLACADLDHLVFLPSGDSALTRRAKKHSPLSAVVLKFSRARRRYERQGLLVTSAALDQAEADCLADQDLRARRQQRAEARRAELDEAYVRQFAEKVRELFPQCPPGREQQIAEHACQKYSGRVGRSAAAKNLSAKTIHLAVVAHVRHAETPYDELLAEGQDREEARAKVANQVRAILTQWQSPS